MREILFRGKQKNNGEWIMGYYRDYPTIHEGVIYNCKYTGDNSAAVIPGTVGQYTGLIDKNGKKIFEGDIVLMPSYHGGKHKSIVYFRNGKFAVDGSNHTFKDICPKRMEVVGNIYDGYLN